MFTLIHPNRSQTQLEETDIDKIVVSVIQDWDESQWNHGGYATILKDDKPFAFAANHERGEGYLTVAFVHGQMNVYRIMKKNAPHAPNDYVLVDSTTLAHPSPRGI